MKINKIKGYLVTGLFLAFPAVHAQSWYGGIGFGNTTIDISSISNSIAGNLAIINTPGSGFMAGQVIDDEDSGVKIFAGYDMNENLAFEFGYADLGEASLALSISSDGTNFPAGNITVDEAYNISGLFGAVVGKLPLSDRVSLQARAGAYMWDVEYEASVMDTTGFFGSGAGSSSDDGNDLFYGAGLNAGWFNLFYEVYDVDGVDVDFLGVSATFNFH